MTSLEKQILKLNEKYIQRFISEIIKMEDITEQQLKSTWKTISSSSSKQSKKGTRKSGYTMFLVENRPSIASSNPHLKSTEIISLVAKQWRELSEEEKDVYKKKALEETSTAKEAVATPVAAPASNNSSMEEMDFSKMSIKDLRKTAEKHGLFTMGKKQELIQRLIDYRNMVEEDTDEDEENDDLEEEEEEEEEEDE